MNILLRDIADYSISTITERYARLGWNPKTGNEIKDAILRRQYATFEIVLIPHGSVKLLALTKTGEDLLAKQGVSLPKKARGGMEHEFWRARLKERCTQRGYRVLEEYSVGNGKKIDLYATDGKRTFFIEIETGKSDTSTNISKLSELAGHRIMFFTNKAALARTPLPSHISGFEPFTLSELHKLLTG